MTWRRLATAAALCCGSAPGDGWRPEDDRAFWDHVARRDRDREPLAT